MEHTEVLKLWKMYDDKVEQALSLNKKNTQEILRIKTKTVLSEMKPIKIFTLLIGFIWVLFGSIIVINLFIYAYNKVSLFFLYSAAIQLLLTTIAIGIYLYQLIMISNVNISDSVIVAQKKLSKLKSSTLWSAKILTLQLPLWTTFYLSKEMIVSGNIIYILVNGFFTLLFVYSAIWLFTNIKYSNRNKKWFKLLFGGKEWTAIINAIEFYKEIEQFEKSHEID